MLVVRQRTTSSAARSPSRSSSSTSSATSTSSSPVSWVRFPAVRPPTITCRTPATAASCCLDRLGSLRRYVGAELEHCSAASVDALVGEQALLVEGVEQDEPGDDDERGADRPRRGGRRACPTARRRPPPRGSRAGCTATGPRPSRSRCWRRRRWRAGEPSGAASRTRRTSDAVPHTRGDDHERERPGGQLVEEVAGVGAQDEDADDRGDAGDDGRPDGPPAEVLLHRRDRPAGGRPRRGRRRRGRRRRRRRARRRAPTSG